MTGEAPDLLHSGRASLSFSASCLTAGADGCRFLEPIGRGQCPHQPRPQRACAGVTVRRDHRHPRLPGGESPGGRNGAVAGPHVATGDERRREGGRLRTPRCRDRAGHAAHALRGVRERLVQPGTIRLTDAVPRRRLLKVLGRHAVAVGCPRPCPSSDRWEA